MSNVTVGALAALCWTVDTDGPTPRPQDFREAEAAGLVTAVNPSPTEQGHTLLALMRWYPSKSVMDAIERHQIEIEREQDESGKMSMLVRIDLEEGASGRDVLVRLWGLKGVDNGREVGSWGDVDHVATVIANEIFSGLDAEITASREQMARVVLDCLGARVELS